MTDLVFIDPVGTGFSDTLGDTDKSAFYDYSNDIRYVSDFIRLYIQKYDRWSSPKYLAGESYGTTRAVGVSNCLLYEYHIALNGMLLISTANDFSVLLKSSSNDIYYVNYLPTYAASAWYHKKLSKKYQSMKLETFLKKVQDFASGEYLTALYKGERLTEKEKRKTANTLSSYIGLPAKLILDNNLRIDLDTFRMSLLADDDLMIGRYDSRYTGPLITDLYGENDPSGYGITEAYTSAYCDYLSKSLGYKNYADYNVIPDEVIQNWTFGYDNQYVSQEDDIRNIMSRSKDLKIWVVCGYYDLATPYSSSEWVYSHVFMNEPLRKNISFTYYKSGHMFYAEENSLKQFRKDAEKWYGNK